MAGQACEIVSWSETAVEMLQVMNASLTVSEGERLIVVYLVVQLQPEQEREVVVAIDQGRRPQHHLGPCCIVVLAEVYCWVLAVCKKACQTDGSQAHETRNSPAAGLCRCPLLVAGVTHHGWL